MEGNAGTKVGVGGGDKLRLMEFRSLELKVKMAN